MFTSTRSKSVNLGSAETIVQGISEEGGLLVPLEFPRVAAMEIAAFARMDYRQLAEIIFGRYLLDDFSQKDIKDTIESAYGAQFDTGEIAQVEKVDDYHVLELWHGPTCAFKDMALQALPTLMTKSAKTIGEKRKLLVLVATSGDTGKAALEGFADVPGALIGVYYPKDGVSAVQKLQMTTQEGSNVFVMGVLGNFDDAQTGVKQIFANQELRETFGSSLRLSSANSINFGRLLPQIAYYFYAYSRLVKQKEIKCGESVNFCVPTGNFGNILAAYYAMRMGLKIKTLICASNQNNVLTDFFNTGVYDADRAFYTTASPSMDILISSNLERLLFEVCDRDAEMVSGLMGALRSSKHYEVDEQVKARLKERFYAGWCGEAETRETIRKTYREHDYLIDPHTAVAVKVYDDYRRSTRDATPTVIVSTASPFKFAEDVLGAILPETKACKDFAAVDALRSATGAEAPSRIDGLRNKPELHTDSCTVSDMTQKLTGWLNARA